MNKTVCALTILLAGNIAAAAQNATHFQKGRTVSKAPPEVVKELAPTGKLRVALNLGNIVLVQADSPTAEPRGVTPELAKELGSRLGVPVEFTRFDGAGKAFDAFKTGALDIIFLAIEPVRAAEVAFTPPYVLIEGVYMVPKDSKLKTVADVDRDGVRIGVNKGSAYDLFLSRSLKHAQLVRGESGVELFVKDKLDAAGGVKQPLVLYAKDHPEVKIMDGRFMEIQQAMGTQKNRPAGSKYLHAFVEEMKKSGFVASALKRSNQPDAAVAPAAQ